MLFATNSYKENHPIFLYYEFQYILPSGKKNIYSSLIHQIYQSLVSEKKNPKVFDKFFYEENNV